MRRLAGALAFSALAAVGCVPMPRGSAQRALYRDLRKIVDLRDRTGWVVDRIDVQEVAPSAMRSACQVGEPARLSLASWLDRRIAAEGGPAREAYRKNGNSLRAIDGLVTLERVRAVLGYTNEHAAADCPFWLTPSPSFAGVEGAARRWVLWLETMGGLSIYTVRDTVTFGGGGVGRLLFTRGVSERLSLGIGAEVGGGGTFPPGDTGGRGLVASFAAAVPILLRFAESAYVYDVEVAPTAWFTEQSVQPRPGVRVATGAGLSTLRVGSIAPHGLLWIGYEYQFALGAEPPVHVFKIGSRVGLDWDY